MAMEAGETTVGRQEKAGSRVRGEDEDGKGIATKVKGVGSRDRALMWTVQLVVR